MQPASTVCLAYSLGGRIQLVPSFILRGGELHIIHKHQMITLGRLWDSHFLLVDESK
jgi:hypothetical protein